MEPDTINRKKVNKFFVYFIHRHHFVPKGKTGAAQTCRPLLLLVCPVAAIVHTHQSLLLATLRRLFSGSLTMAVMDFLCRT